MNLEQVRTLTDEQLRIRVAELCGWKYGPCPCGACIVHEKVWCRDGKPPYYNSIDMLPDYPRDLNAMHEAWELLSEEQRLQITDKLVTIQSCLPDKDRFVVGATARQRAEAFVLAMDAP